MPIISNVEVKNASITKKNLLRLLEAIRGNTTLVAPVRNAVYGDVNFLPVTDPAEIVFDYDNTTTSPKEFFFPQYEPLFTFSSPSVSSIEVKDVAEEIVLFGIRACDVNALVLLDRFYERNFGDNYYLDKRRKSTLITLACTDLGEQCFCTSTGTGPVLTTDFDIQLIETGKDYAVQVGSEKGLLLFEAYKDFFGPATNIDASTISIEAKNKGLMFDLDKVYNNLKTEAIDEQFWQDIANRCQSCGLCLFLCPTCSCFSVIDQATPLGEKRRSRQWDACYFTGMTTMAGGNNPVADRAQMVKRKYYHKLCQQIDEFGVSGCVGCGRCNLCCVGNVNWLENVIKIERNNARV